MKKVKLLNLLMKKEKVEKSKNTKTNKRRHGLKKHVGTVGMIALKKYS